MAKTNNKKRFITANSHGSSRFGTSTHGLTIWPPNLTVNDQAWGQDDWILAKFFVSVKTQKKNEANIQPSWPNKLVYKGFIIWLYCQVRTTKNPKQNMKLFYSLQPAGVRFVFSTSSVGLGYNHRKLRILNYHNDFVLSNYCVRKI